MKRKLKTMSSLKSDAEAEAFVEKADLSEFDLSLFKPIQFEFKKKSAALTSATPGRD